MAKKISSLSVVLGATTAPFVSAFGGAGGAVTGLVGKLGSAGKSILKFGGIAAGIGGVLGGAGMGILLKQQMDAIDSSAKLSDRLAISTEALTGLQHAAGLAGVSNEQLTGGFEKMLNSVGEAAQGTGEAVNAFARMGLEAEALKNMAPDAAFKAISDKLAGVTNAAERASLAQDIFGRSGQQLLPLMMSGAAGIDAMIGEADALGLSFNRLDAAKVEEANDAITRMKSVGVGVFRSLAIAAAPFITDFANRFIEGGKVVVGTVKSWLPSITAGVTSIWQIITNTFNSIYAVVAPIVTSIGAFIVRNWQSTVATATSFYMSMWNMTSTVFSAIWDIIKTIGAGIVGTWNWAMGLLGVETTTTGATVGSVFQRIVDVGRWFSSQVSLGFNVLAYVIKNWRQTLDVIMAGAIYSVLRFANETIHFFTDVIPGVLSWFAGNWRDIFTTIWSGTKAVFTNMATNAMNFFTALWSWMKGDGFNFEWTGLLTGFENTIKEMPQIAERVVGPMEQAWGAAASQSTSAWTDGLAQSLAAQDQAVKDATNGMASALDSAADLFTPPELEAPIIPPAEFAVNADTTALEDVSKKAKETTTQLKALTAGSAEAMKARYAAPLALAVNGSAAASASPSAAALPASTSRAMRESADPVFQKMLAESQRQTGLLDEIASDRSTVTLSAADI